MGRMGYGYGSEWHLMRYMARHRKFLEDKILSVIGQSGVIEWVDFEFESHSESCDRELQGLEFLKGVEYQGIINTWKNWWPTTGKQPSWDSIAWMTLQNSQHPELLLFEAKAHLGEIKSDSQAGDVSRKKILDAFVDVQNDLGIPPQNDWLKQYYQHANKIAVLWFLNSHKRIVNSTSEKVIPTRLINVYFIGEVHRGWQCPQTEEEWKPAITARDMYLGLDHIDGQLPVHSVFIQL